MRFTLELMCDNFVISHLVPTPAMVSFNISLEGCTLICVPTLKHKYD